MFSIFSKKNSLKKVIKKNLTSFQLLFSNKSIQTVGIIIDETQVKSYQKLINLLHEYNINANNIKILTYKDKITKNETLTEPFLCFEDVSATGIFQKNSVLDFLYTPFDMLISYYDIDKEPLILATIQSKAVFKVGFSSTHHKTHHLMIQTRMENHQEFITELFKYLKILKKI